MLVIPSLIDDSLDRDKMINSLAKPSEKKYGIVSLVSSFNKSETYKHLGSLVPKSQEISAAVEHLKKGKFTNNSFC